jgi:FAD/FMN-containing dehydrogenase
LIVRLFDRNTKLRSRLRAGRLLDEPKQMLSLLKGRLSKEDLPAFIAEPADLDELRATLEFAAEKHMRVAVAAGLTPTAVRDLSGNLLLLTSRLSTSPIISTVRRTARVSGGLPAESLAIDLARDSMEWWPLFPVPPGKSVGGLIAEGWEGVRNFRRGGTLTHIQQIDWIGYDGKPHSTGVNSPEASGVLFGSRGMFGLITSALLTLRPACKARSAALLEFTAAQDAAACIGDFAASDPQPETVVFWGRTPTEIIRTGNDGTVADGTRCLVLAEWEEERVQLPPPWDAFATYHPTDAEVRVLWQDVLRMPRTAARLYPERLEARVRLPLEAIPDVEEAAAELGRDSNFPLAVWGTVEVGYTHLWVMLPDQEALTRNRGRETLNKLIEIAISLGAKRACGNGATSRVNSSSPEGKYAEGVRELMKERCDPAAMHFPLNGD